MILIMINIDKHQRSKLAKLFECTTMVHYSENPTGMGIVVFAKVQEQVKFESPGTLHS